MGRFICDRRAIASLEMQRPVIDRACAINLGPHFKRSVFAKQTQLNMSLKHQLRWCFIGEYGAEWNQPDDQRDKSKINIRSKGWWRETEKEIAPADLHCAKFEAPKGAKRLLWAENEQKWRSGVGYISLSVYLYLSLSAAIYQKIYLVVHPMVSAKISSTNSALMSPDEHLQAELCLIIAHYVP